MPAVSAAHEGRVRRRSLLRGQRIRNACVHLRHRRNTQLRAQRLSSLPPQEATGNDFARKIESCLATDELEKMSETALEIYRTKLNWRV